MKQEEIDLFMNKLRMGLALYHERLVTRYAKDDRSLIISRNGEIITVKARDLKG